jgi:hypothetical protein
MHVDASGAIRTSATLCPTPAIPTLCAAFFDLYVHAYLGYRVRLEGDDSSPDQSSNGDPDDR